MPETTATTVAILPQDGTHPSATASPSDPPDDPLHLAIPYRDPSAASVPPSLHNRALPHTRMPHEVHQQAAAHRGLCVCCDAALPCRTSEPGCCTAAQRSDHVRRARSAHSALTKRSTVVAPITAVVGRSSDARAAVHTGRSCCKRRVCPCSCGLACPVSCRRCVNCA
jgi:hypothetical protein